MQTLMDSEDKILAKKDVGDRILDTYFEGDVERYAHHFSLDDMVEHERRAGNILGPFERQWLVENAAPERVRKLIQKAKEHPTFVGARGSVAGGLDTLAGFPTAAFTARNTTSSEMNIIGDTANGAPPAAMVQQFMAIPPNDPKPGVAYEVMWGASYGITGTPTVIFTPRWGSSTTIGTNVTLGASQTITTVAGPTNIFCHFVFGIRTAPPGATLGTGIGHGFVKLGMSTAVSSQFALSGIIGATAATIDTSGQGTAGCGIQFGITWSASSASNTSTVQWYLLQSRN